MMNEVFVLSTSKVKSIPGVKFFFAFVKLESVLSLLISVEFSNLSLWSTFLDRPKMNEWILAFFTNIGIYRYTQFTNGTIPSFYMCVVLSRCRIIS